MQDKAKINQRLDKVEFLTIQPDFRKHLNENIFRRTPDLDKLAAKFYRVYSKKKNHGADL